MSPNLGVKIQSIMARAVGVGAKKELKEVIRSDVYGFFLPGITCWSHDKKVRRRHIFEFFELSEILGEI